MQKQFPCVFDDGRQQMMEANKVRFKSTTNHEYDDHRGCYWPAMFVQPAFTPERSERDGP